jgi:hypothetical protein
MTHTSVELTARCEYDTADTINGLIDLRFTPPDYNISREVAVNVPAQFDIRELLRYSSDAVQYGNRLAEMLFADELLRREWEKTYAYTQSLETVLRFRLRLDLPFHILRWETLSSPLHDWPICFSERILFSRYFDSADLVPIRIPNKPELKALIAVSNPEDLSAFDLARVGVDDEILRVTSALGDIPSTPVTCASVNNIIDGLRSGCNVLYLVCHGASKDGETRLWLEKDDGTTDLVSGKELVKRIQSLPRCPLLLILASCQSATFSSETSGVTLGPLIASAGVPAVIAMQGNVTMSTVASLMPLFFNELRRDGQVDRAMAAARGMVLDRSDWWMPVLFMRMWDGRLWNESLPAPHSAGDHIVRSRTERLRELKQLYDEGLITAKDYEETKSRILDGL